MAGGSLPGGIQEVCYPCSSLLSRTYRGTKRKKLGTCELKINSGLNSIRVGVVPLVALGPIVEVRLAQILVQVQTMMDSNPIPRVTFKRLPTDLQGLAALLLKHLLVPFWGSGRGGRSTSSPGYAGNQNPSAPTVSISLSPRPEELLD
jgi:hypothetical protein